MTSRQSELRERAGELQAELRERTDEIEKAIGVIGCLEESVTSFLKEMNHPEDECQLCLDLGSARNFLKFYPEE